MNVRFSPVKLIGLALLCPFLISSIQFVGPSVDGAYAADTTADCGRFYLKLNKKTNQMECVNKSRRGGNRGVTARGIQLQQRAVGQILQQVTAINQQQDLTEEDRRRVKSLLTDARQRVREIQQQTAELRQEQLARTRALSSEQDRRARQVADVARALEQQQQNLTRQLITQQRQFTKNAQGR